MRPDADLQHGHCFPRRGETTILKCRVAIPEVLVAVMVTG